MPGRPGSRRCDGEQSRAGILALHSNTSRLLPAERGAPGEDVLSDLVAAQRDDETLTGEAVAGLAAAQPFAGHETTVNRIDAGVLRLSW